MSDKIKDNKKDALKPSTELSSQTTFSKLFSNNHQIFLSKKVERLTSALYVITGFISSDEPVRNRLRSRSLDLIKLSSTPTSFTGDGVEAFKSASAEIGMLLQTAYSAGLISKMNSDLLCEEYASLALFAESQAERIQAPSVVQESTIAAAYIGQGDVNPAEAPDSNKKPMQNSKGHSNGNGKKGQINRRKVLMDLLNKKDRISIKDAASAIDGCSEKTIQRELLALVRDGLAIKEGERRWSSYRKASPLPTT